LRPSTPPPARSRWRSACRRRCGASLRDDLLGIRGDNTYSNYAEANRTFWRQTVLPLVNRTAKALSAWLAPAYASPPPVSARGERAGVRGSNTLDVTLDLRPDLDAIEALSPEREALWARLEKATFLTADEKRSAVGYAPLEEVSDPATQVRANPYHDERAGISRQRNIQDP
jgi:phage portal protein BeeE